MQCSKCGFAVNPVVVLDLDGTLADYHYTFTRFCELYFGTICNYAYDGSVDFEYYLGLTRAEYREAKLAYRQGGNKRWMPMYPGVMDLVDSIQTSAFPCEIWIATTRPYQRLDNIDPDTLEWLHRNHLNMDGLLYGEDKYRRLTASVEQARIVAAVEDLPDQFDIAAKMGIPVIQIERQHNSGPGCERAPRGNMAMVQRWIQNRIEKWHKEKNI